MTDAYWLNEDSRTFLSRGYLKPGQTAEERIREIGENAEKILNKMAMENSYGYDNELHKGYADKFYDYMMKGWISLASPVWSNFGSEKDLPISCNGSYIDDDTGAIFDKVSEIGIMTKKGSGTSAYLGALRPRGTPYGDKGGYTDGPVRFAELFELTTDVISQGSVRRGACAVYLPIEHKDIEEFLEIREEGHSIQNLSIGVTVTDKFMEDMIAGDEHNRKIWLKVLKKRTSTGYPYIMFIDNANNARPQVYKDKEMLIYASNLCSEIMLPSSPDESFVCCLSSLNILHYDDWKNTDLVETMTYFLDAVIEEYIQKTSTIKHMEAAYKFAKRHRAIGLGTLGWHSYLQSKMIAFESFEAKLLNAEIHKFVDQKSLSASKQMAVEFGEPEILVGYGLRNTTRMAIAPTTSSSFILGQVSPSIEPLNDNYFVGDLAKGKFSFKNPYLKKLLQEKGYDNDETWMDIAKHGGSVQHMVILDDHEKDVYKTFGEISQMEIVIQAAQRQKFIDQGQSLNLAIHPNSLLKEVNAIYIEMWKLKLKAAYYQKGTNPVLEQNRNLLNCESCSA